MYNKCITYKNDWPLVGLTYTNITIIVIKIVISSIHKYRLYIIIHIHNHRLFRFTIDLKFANNVYSENYFRPNVKHDAHAFKDKNKIT